MNRLEEAARERNEHAASMRDKYLDDAIPSDVANDLYAYAWEEGHANGWHEVEAIYADLAALVERTFRAGGAA